MDSLLDQFRINSYFWFYFSNDILYNLWLSNGHTASSQKDYLDHLVSIFARVIFPFAFVFFSCSALGSQGSHCRKIKNCKRLYPTTDWAVAWKREAIRTCLFPTVVKRNKNLRRLITPKGHMCCLSRGSWLIGAIVWAVPAAVDICVECEEILHRG